MIDTIIRFYEACHPFGLPLALCSVIMLTAVLYHIFFTGHNRSLRRLALALERIRTSGEDPAPTLTELCAADNSPLARVALYLLRHREDASLPNQVEAQLRLYIDSQRVGMATISIITNIAPMLGILGTAWGLVHIFGVFGSQGAEQNIATGISTALYTTIFGLAIAVPGIIALSCFERSLERRAAYINRLFTELMALCDR